MDNLVEQLRARANSLAGAGSTDLLTQAADTLAAQARLLELAETLAGAAGIASIEPTTTRLADLRDANTAFRAAQAEYQTTGKVPCPECLDMRWRLSEALEQRDKARETEVLVIAERDVAHQEWKMWLDRYNAASAERDEARRQLAEAQERNNELHLELQCRLMNLRTAGHETSKILADNAALVEMTKVRQEALCRVRAMNWNLGGPANRDANGAWVVHPDWEQKMLGIIADAIGPLNGDAPLGDHPGAGLLAELAALRKVAEALTGHDHGHLSRWVTTLKQSDGEGWAIGEMVQRYLDAIHRKDDR